MYSQSPPMQSWMPDDACDACHKCKIPFNFFTRRHHCRVCCHVFCNDCTKYRSKIDMLSSTHADKSNVRSLQSISDFFGITTVHNNEHRVCLKCLRRHSRVQMSKTFIYAMSINPHLSVLDWSVMKQVCRVWNAGVQYMHKRWNHIQRPIVLSSRMLDVDRYLLRQNEAFVYSHPVLECRFYQTWVHSRIQPQQRQQLSCTQMRCRHSCTELPTYVIVCMRLMFLPVRTSNFQQTVHSLRKLEYDILYALVPFLLWQSLRKPCILQHIPSCVHNACYWYSQTHAELKSIRDKFSTSSCEATQSLVTGLCNFLSHAPQPSAQACIEYVSSVVRKHAPLLPYESETGTRVFCIYYQSKRELSSASKPLVVDVLVGTSKETAQRRTIMLKKEHVEFDFMIMNVQRYLLHLDILFEPYYVAPIQARDTLHCGCGLILFDTGVTLRNIQLKYRNSIAEYVMLHNPTAVVADIQTKFYRSCAAQAILTLLFEVGDRHLDNILVSKDGRLYHIDFSYIYSEPVLSAKMASLGRQTIRLTPAMLSHISENYHQQFLQECKRINRCIRRHIASLYCICWVLIQQNLFSTDTLVNNLEKYLCSDCTEELPEQDTLILNLLKTSEQRSETSAVQKIVSNASALWQSSPVRAAASVHTAVGGIASTVKLALNLRSLFGLP